MAKRQKSHSLRGSTGYRKRTQRYTRRRQRNTRRIRRRQPAGMSRKQILDITSTKKRDVMQPAAAINISGAPITPVQQLPVYFAPNTSTTDANSPPNVVLWCPTARTMSTGNATSADVYTGVEATRTSTTCFIRGLKERIHIQTNDPTCWLWRRIVFRMRTQEQASPGTNPTSGIPSYYATDVANNFYPFYQSTNGFQRAVSLVPGNRSSGTQYDLFEVLFRGQNASDWSDPMDAPVDTRRVDLCSDKTMRIASGNAVGVEKIVRRWYPMNKNLVYNDDQTGGFETQSVYSVGDKRGMGDLWVCDLIRSSYGSPATARLAAHFESTLYWHEK